jgi:hypothetical protein
VAKRMRSGTGVFVLPSRLQKAMSAAMSPHGDGALAWTPSVANRACAAARWTILKSEASGVGGVESKGEEGCCLPSKNWMRPDWERARPHLASLPQVNGEVVVYRTDML